MKEINTNKLFEKKLRIYDLWLLEDLNKFYDEHRKRYKNSMNEMFVDLIKCGLEVEKIQEQNRKDYNGRFETISNKMTTLQKAIEDSNFANQFNLKDLAIRITILEKLLARSYNILFAFNENGNLNKQTLLAGFYDYLPEDLDEMYNDLRDHFEKVISDKARIENMMKIN